MMNTKHLSIYCTIFAMYRPHHRGFNVERQQTTILNPTLRIFSILSHSCPGYLKEMSMGRMVRVWMRMKSIHRSPEIDLLFIICRNGHQNLRFNTTSLETSVKWIEKQKKFFVFRFGKSNIFGVTIKETQMKFLFK